MALSPAMLAKISHVARTGRLPRPSRPARSPSGGARVGLDGEASVPADSIVWYHRQDGFDSFDAFIARARDAAASGSIDVTTDEGRALFRGLLLGISRRAIAFFTTSWEDRLALAEPHPPDQAVDGVRVRLGKNMPLGCDEADRGEPGTLSAQDQLFYCDLVGDVLRFVEAYGSRAAAHLGRRDWDDPQASPRFLPLYTENGDTRTWSHDPPFEVPPLVTVGGGGGGGGGGSGGGGGGGGAGASIGAAPLVWVVAILAGAAIVCWTVSTVSEHQERAGARQDAIAAAKDPLTAAGARLDLAMAHQHEAEATAGKPLPPIAELVAARQEMQKALEGYNAVTRKVAESSVPPPPLSNVIAKEAGGFLRSLAWAGAFVGLGAIVIRTLADRPIVPRAPRLSDESIRSGVRRAGFRIDEPDLPYDLPREAKGYVAGDAGDAGWERAERKKERA